MNKVDIIKKHIGNVNFHNMIHNTNGTLMLTNILKAMEEYKEQVVKNCSIADVSKRLELDGLAINPIDKDGDFEIEIEGDFQGDAFNYLTRENAIKLATYILDSI